MSRYPRFTRIPLACIIVLLVVLAQPNISILKVLGPNQRVTTFKHTVSNSELINRQEYHSPNLPYSEGIGSPAFKRHLKHFNYLPQIHLHLVRSWLHSPVLLSSVLSSSSFSSAFLVNFNTAVHV